MQALNISVQSTNAIEFTADVLGLKYAQGLFGLDQNIISRLDAEGYHEFDEHPPENGASVLLATHGVIAAPYILVVGIDPSHQFSYGSVRNLGYRFLSSLTDHYLGETFRHLAVTVHGVGFGLKLLEAFRAELLGMADAYEKGECSPHLEQVSFIERRTDAARAMEAELQTMLKAHPAVRAMVHPDEEKAIQRKPQAGKSSDKFIFISYARTDESMALQIADDLRQEQFPIWIDQINIHLGAHWDKTIQEALRNSSLMLLILTSESAQSDNVADEYHYFLTNQKPIIPILVGDFDMQHMPYRLSRRQYIDFRGDYKLSVAKLVETLRQQLNHI